MYQRYVCFVALVLVLGMTVPGMGADEKIYWVADDIGGGDSDQGFVDLLTDAGYTVDMRFSDQELRVLEDTELELLNRADLIIISRDSDSRQYDDGAVEKANWNSKIARPILNLNAFYMQANRWNWVPASDTWHYAAGPMRVLEPDHPVMEGVTIVDGLVDVVTTQTTFPEGATDAAAGTLIGVREDNGFVWLAAWDTTQNISMGYPPSGPRMLFCCGLDEATTGKQPALAGNGTYNLTEEGNKIFLNAVKYLLEYTLEKAAIPSPEDGAVLSAVSVELSWAPADGTVSDNVYFGDNLEAVTNATPASAEFKGNQVEISYTVEGLVPGNTYYWRIDGVPEDDPDHPLKGDVWSFFIAPLDAYDPSPVNEARLIGLDPVLTWRAGVNTQSHRVYFGTRAEAVANATPASPEYKSLLPSDITTWQPVADGLMTLEYNTRYFWRVDEESTNGTQKGEVWSFETTHPGLGTCTREVWTGIQSRIVDDLRADPRFPDSPTEVNELTLFDSNANLGDWNGARIKAWLHAPFTGTYTFKLSSYSPAELWLGTTPDDRTQRQLIVEVPIERLLRDDWRYSSEPIPLEANRRYYIEALWVTTDNNGSGSQCQAAWEGPGIRDIEVIQGSYLEPFEALWAYGANPSDGAVDVSQTPAPLSWKAGTQATQHDVYFGDDEIAVAEADTTTPGIYRGRQPLENTSYVLTEVPLEWNKTYYWRVDEIDDTNPDSPWKGKVWSFTTANFVIVDDFESYTDNDTDGEAIWQHWIDGFGVADNGAQVGYLLPPYAEQTIIHSGRKSMPLMYNNTGGVTNSEGSLALTTPRDWTQEGLTDLSLWFRGYPGSVGSFMEAPAGTFTMTGSGADIWGTADQFHFAFKMLNGPGSIVARINSVANTHTWAKAGVMIRETLEAGSKYAFACVTPENGVSSEGRTAVEGTSFRTNQTGITAPHWVKLERDNGGNFTVTHSANGTAWQPVAGATPHNITMASNVYIGLALTSHDAGLTCQAVFSNVTTTGSVSGQWAHQDIGITSNSAEPLYVAISNASGAPAVVANDDPAAATIDAWTQWRIPLQAFADQGVNLGNVDKLAIGLGSQSGIVSDGGSGTVYIDDIRLYQP